MKKFLLALSLFALMGADDNGCGDDSEHLHTDRAGRCKDSAFDASSDSFAHSCPDGTRMEVQPMSKIVVCRCPTGASR
jgi:hypothetical protein